MNISWGTQIVHDVKVNILVLTRVHKTNIILYTLARFCAHEECETNITKDFEHRWR